MVVHIITRLAMGGAQQQAFEIVSRMHRSNKEVVIFTGLSDTKKSLSALDNKILEAVYDENIPVEVIPSLTDRISFLSDLKSLIKIFRLLKIHKPTVVHIHSSKTGILGRVACKFLNIDKVIYHVHGWSFSSSTGLSHKLYLFLEKLFYSFTTEYIFVCKQDMIDFINLGGNSQIEEKSHVIYPGAYFLNPNKVDQARANLRKKLGISNSDHIIGTVARLDFQKNPQIFVEIANEYLKKDSNAKFLWIGKGASLNEVESLIEEFGLSDKFILPGYVDDVEPYFSVFDTFVLTSRYEGLPVTILKALACKIPVVGFQVNGFHDLADQFKSIFGAKPLLIKEFVEKLLEAKTMMKTDGETIKKEAEYTRNHFNIDTMYNNVIKVYDA